MDIRSITLFCDPDFDPAAAARFYAAAPASFSIPVQTLRLATPPFPDWWQEPAGLGEVTRTARDLAEKWRAAGADYISLGPVRLRHDDQWLARVSELLSATEVLFASAEIADENGRIDLGRCRQVAAVIRQVSTILDNGFGNLYLAALANCPPGSPFFPVAYHQGGPATFAIAVEAADLALTAIQGSGTLEEARTTLVGAIEGAATELTADADALAAAHGIPFSGIDFSLAPYPTGDKSLVGGIEALGVPRLGAPGSLFGATFLTEAIQRARFRRCGFSGLMLPVLEDSVLALRAAEGRVTVNDLLAYSAVCGTGLDTIPLPGEISESSLTAILLDVAALAARLNKPLTARLMPLPGLAAGDPVQFDFPYFADSRVMQVTGSGLTGALAASGGVMIQQLHGR
ncbi:MAG: DUF711 family protein [Anaerolineae bacterium]